MINFWPYKKSTPLADYMVGYINTGMWCYHVGTGELKEWSLDPYLPKSEDDKKYFRRKVEQYGDMSPTEAMDVENLIASGWTGTREYEPNEGGHWMLAYALYQRKIDLDTENLTVSRRQFSHGTPESERGCYEVSFKIPVSIFLEGNKALKTPEQQAQKVMNQIVLNINKLMEYATTDEIFNEHGAS